MFFSAAILTLFPLILASQAVYGESGYTPQGLSIGVQRDGSAIVDYTATLLDPTTPIPLPGFTADASPTLKALDSMGESISYSTDGDAILVSTEPGDLIRITYKTFTLTQKNIDTWTLSVSSPINWSASFPLDTTITSFSATPAMVRKGEPALFLMPSGSQWITYRLSYEEPVKAQEGKETWFEFNFMYFFIASLATGSGFLVYQKFRWKWVARRLVAKHKQLRDEEKRILVLLGDNKGRALEADIANRIDLPRTTTWRHIKRLEDDHIVVVEKMGTQNLVKIKSFFP